CGRAREAAPGRRAPPEPRPRAARARFDDEAVHEAGRDAELALVGGDGVQRGVEHHATEVEDDGPERHEGRTLWRLNPTRRPADAPRMEASDDVRPDHRSAPLPALGQVLAQGVGAFGAKPLLGAVLVDATPISRIEDSHGHSARATIMLQLGALVSSVAKQMFGDDAIVVTGETGRLEVVVLTFR